MIPADSDDIVREFNILLNELKQYNPELVDKQRILAITKCDLVDDATLKDIRKKLPRVPIVFISSATGKGIDELKDKLWAVIHENK